MAMLTATLHGVAVRVIMKGGRDWWLSSRSSNILASGTAVPTFVAIRHGEDGSMENHSNEKNYSFDVVHRSISHPVDDANQSSSTRQPESKVTALTKGLGSQFASLDGSRHVPAWLIGSSPFIFCVVLAACLRIFGQSLVDMSLIAAFSWGAFRVWIRYVRTS